MCVRARVRNLDICETICSYITKLLIVAYRQRLHLDLRPVDTDMGLEKNCEGEVGLIGCGLLILVWVGGWP